MVLRKRTEAPAPTRTAGRALVQLLGALALEHDGRRAVERDLPGRQPRLLFAALVWDHGRAIPHDALAEILWPAGPPAAWQPALRGLVLKVRAMFDLVGLEGRSTVSSERGCYRVDLPPDAIVDVEVSVDRVADAARLLEEGDVEAAHHLAGEARSVLSRPLLAGIDSPWLDRRRDEVSAALSHCLEILGECRLRAGDHVHAASVVEELLRSEPFREPAWRLLMRIHAAAGNIAEALQAYERCRALLEEELGTDPSTETQELHVRILRMASRGADLPAADEPAPARGAASVTGPPYRGLHPFDEDDGAVFFGRDTEVDVLLERLRSGRLVVVVGPSGSGKSSLVRAGLLPALRAGALPDADIWRRIVLVPGSRPLDSLAAALLRIARDDAGRNAIRRLREGASSLHEAVSVLLAGGPAGERVVFVVDQFEEVFTSCRDEDARQRFISVLISAARHPEGSCVVVLTLRADFYGRAIAYADLASALSTDQVVVPPLDGDGLQIAIEMPARLAGLRFEDGLVGRIVADVAGEPGALPLLQHALLELYERRAERVLTGDAYEDIGGVSGALARHAEDLWAKLDARARRTARRVLLRLVEPGERTDDTRRRATVDELAGDPAIAHHVEAVIDRLARARLLVTTLDPATGSRTIEIAHEALLRGWPRLASWIEEGRTELHIHRRLTAEAQEWDAHERHVDFLLSGARLAQAEGWISRDEAALNHLERSFLSASIEAEAGRRRRRARVRRLVTGGLVAGLLLVGSLAAVASLQWTRANEEGDLARSRAVAAEAVNQLEIDPELSLLLAREAYEIATTAQAEGALRQALVRSTLRHRLRTKGNSPLVEIDPAGELVATMQLDGSISVWEVSTGTHIVELTDGASSPGLINAMAFSPDGTRFLASTLDGSAWIWTLPDGELTTSITWPGQGELVYIVVEEGAGWSPDGSRVVLSGFDGRARIFDATSGRIVARLRGPGEARDLLARARFTPDGRRLAVEGSRGRIRIFDVSTGSPLAEMRGHDAHLWSMKFSDDGAWLVTSSEDGTARIWDTETGRELQAFPHDVPVRDVAVTGDAGRVLTGDAAGIARIWDPETAELLLELKGHDDRVNQVRLDASGRLALTASIDGTARVWDAGTGDAIALLTGSAEAVPDAELSPAGDVVVTAGDDARIWRVPQGAVSVIEAHEGAVFDVAFSADGTRMISGGLLDGRARVWDLPERRELSQLPLESHAADGRGSQDTSVWVDISPDGALAVTAETFQHGPSQGERTDPVRVWDAETGEMVAELPLPTDDPLSVCGGPCGATQARFSPDGTRVAVGGFDGRVRVFDARTGRSIMAAGAGEETVPLLDWRPDGRAVLGFHYGPSGRKSVLYDASTGNVLEAIPASTQPMTYGQLEFAPGGRRAVEAVGSTARIYELKEGRVLSELRHRGAVLDASFSPDGALVVTASASGASIWDVASQRRLTDLPGPRGASTATFMPDGKIAVGGVDGSVRFYRCEVCRPADRLLELARARATRGLTPAERARFLHG